MEYYLYFTDRQSHVLERLDLVCNDDSQAIEVALAHADGRSMELWQRSRVVKRFAAEEPG